MTTNTTTDMRAFYNTSLAKGENPYEHERWFSTPERHAAYDMTRAAVRRYVLPYVKKGMRLLEVGAGPGTWTKELLAKEPTLAIDIVDISDEMLAQAKAGLEGKGTVRFIRSDFAEYKAYGEYDAFFSSRALEYMPKKEEIVDTIAASLKKGGRGFIITKYPHYTRARLLGGAVPDVHRLQVAPHTLAKLIAEHGCVVEKKAPVTFVFPKMRSSVLDTLLYNLCDWLPLALVAPLCESYLIIFRKQ